jgi:hypothetical protein
MKKRNKHFLNEKEYIRLKKELNDNLSAQRNLGWVELPQPQFIGYIAKLEPRQDIQNRDDAWVFWYICQKFGTTYFARKIEYFDWNRKKKHSYYIPINKPHIHAIGINTYLDLPPQVQKYFRTDTISNSWRVHYYCDVPNFYWEIIYEKEYKTKVRLIDEILQQEEAEIESKINRKFYNQNHMMSNAPKHFRRSLNRSQRAKSKKTLHNIWKKDMNCEFEDNYRGAAWLWW